MPLKTLPFDGAEYLESHEGQIELLADAASTGDATYIRHALDVVARARYDRHRSRRSNPACDICRAPLAVPSR